MISVIIPTMWRAVDYTKPMMAALDQHPLVGEIILIDNDRSKTEHEFLKTISKLTYWCFEEGNIYVNPAWNFGAKVAKFDKLFILNDDCLLNIKQLDKIYDEITPDKGMIAFSGLSYCTYTIEAFDSLCNSGFGEEISLEIIDPKQYSRTSGMPHPFYGSAYFIHKESYYEIPKEFKIYYGDLFIYVSNLKNGKGNYLIDDGLVMTQYSSTVSTTPIKDILVYENSVLKEVFERHDLKDIKYKIKIPEK